MVKKVLKTVVFIVVFILALTSLCYAADSDTTVRVRVRRARKFNEQVDLKGYDSIKVYDLLISETEPILTLGNNVDVLLDGYYDTKYLIQDAPDSNTMIGPYHLKLSEYVYDNYFDAKSTSDTFTNNTGLNFYPYYDGNSYVIYCGAFVSESSASQTKGTLVGYNLNSEVVNGLNENILVYDTSNQVVFMYSSNHNIYFGSYSSDLNCTAIRIDNSIYRGMIAFKAMSGKLISINKVQLNYYLYGVIANEIVSTWHIEAIKAQTVAARTYAVSNITPNSSNGYDLEDNQNSQVYGGVSSERAVTNSAVDETDGLMIYYNNKLITAFFHSTSGGRTENSENIWVTPLPYLKAVDDPYSNASPYTSWQKVATKSYVLNKVQAEYPNVTDIYGISITKVSENERVLECIISTNIGDIILKKEYVRAVLGYDFLLSSWFTLSTDCDVYLISENSLKSNEESENTDNNQDTDTDSGSSNLDNLLPDEPENSQDDNDNNDNNDNDDNDDSDSNDENSQANDDDKRVTLAGKYFISASSTGVLNSSSLSVISSSGVSDLPTVPTEYYFDGRGWGHGVGMSQYGAKKMAEEGFTFDQILKYYYTGVEIK